MTDTTPAEGRWRPLRVLGLILGSALFFPVSCITATVVGTQGLSQLDARDLRAGEQPHDLFHVLVRVPAQSDTVSVLTLDEQQELQPRAPSHSYLMREPQGEVQHARGGAPIARVRWRAEPLAGNAQRIEVHWADDDYSATSVYIARADSTQLLSSRIYAPGYAFKAMPWGIGFAFLTWAIGKLLLRHEMRRC